MTILETTCNQLYRLVSAEVPGMPHVFLGVPVKRAAGGFVDRVKAKQQIVRRAGCRIVAEA